MNYSEQLHSIKLTFPELDLLRESEFDVFENQEFAFRCINSCVELSNNASKKLKISVNFGVKYDYTLNANARVKNKIGVIILNLGLIKSLESVVSESIEIFYKESVAKFTVLEKDKVELKILLADLCFSYVFYHELAHVLQMLDVSSGEDYNFQEQYIDINSFNINNHVYEFDADLFGISMSTFKLLEFARNKSYPINPVLLFNLLTLLLFSIANIIILFSKNQFNTIYYKNSSHPHPLIRIFKCNEQILSLISNNIQIQKEILLAILSRTITMIDQLKYNNQGQINYSNLVQENISEIDKYIDEVETINESYNELTRWKSHEICNSLIS